MRTVPLLLFLAGTCAFAQFGAPPREAALPERAWVLGVQGYSPTLTGHFQGTQDGLPFAVDLGADLGLAREARKAGFYLEYQGPRFALEASSGTAAFAGDRVVTRSVVVHGVTYSLGSRVQSTLDLKTWDATWTVKILTDRQLWLGLDLGVEAWSLDMTARGGAPAPATPLSAASALTVPIPQVGLSLGLRSVGGTLEARGHLRTMQYKNSHYTRYGGDLRVYPRPWMGLRCFYEATRIEVPRGSLADDLDLHLDRTNFGLGALVRF